MGGDLLEGGGHYRGLQSVVLVPRRVCECFNVVSRGGTHYGDIIQFSGCQRRDGPRIQGWLR